MANRYEQDILTSYIMIINSFADFIHSMSEDQGRGRVDWEQKGKRKLGHWPESSN